MMGSATSGNPTPALLRGEVGRRAPEGFFADEPHAVGDVVDEAALAFKALGEDEELQHGTATEAIVLKASAIAVALVVKKRGREQRLPAALPVRFGARHNGSANVIGNRLPGFALAPIGIRMPCARGDKLALEKRLAVGGAEQIVRSNELRRIFSAQ